jgi:hypothetical protein
MARDEHLVPHPPQIDAQPWNDTMVPTTYHALFHGWSLQPGQAEVPGPAFKDGMAALSTRLKDAKQRVNDLLEEVQVRRGV